MAYFDSLYGNEENDWASGGLNLLDLFRRQSQSQLDPTTNFSQYYQQFGGNMPPAVSPNDFEYLDPNDPELSHLRELGAKDSGARGVLENYYSSMPTHEQYKPGIGRKIAGFLLGTLSGTGAKGAESFLEHPYRNALEEWKNQGQGAVQRAKNLESAKSDEFNAVKLGLNLRTAAARARASQIAANNRQAGTNAGRVINDQNVDEAMKLRWQNLKDLEESRQSRRELMGLDRQIKQKELENLQNFGRRQAPTESMPKGASLVSARKAASEDIMSEYPELFDPETGGFKAEVDMLTRQKIQRYRDSLTALYQQGKRPVNLGEEE